MARPPGRPGGSPGGSSGGDTRVAPPAVRQGPRPVPPPPRPWTPRQLAARIGVIALSGLLIVVLHFTGTLDALQRRIFPPPVRWSDDYSVVEHLRDRVVRDGLTRDARECLLFIIDGNDPPQAQRMRVMEKHNASCPGPRGVLPRLFTLRIDRARGLVEDDRGTPGQFHPTP